MRQKVAIINIRKLFKLDKIAVSMLCLLRLMAPVRVYALQESKLFEGATNLLNDAINVLVVLEAVIVVVLEVMSGIKYQAAEPEEKAKHKKNMMVTIGVGVLVISMSAIIPVIFGYFK